MSFCELEAVEMSDLQLHIKALDYLIAYSESEQYDPSMDEMNILLTNQFVIAELRYMKKHILDYHEGIRAMELVDTIQVNIGIMQIDDKNFRALIYDRMGGK